MFAAVRGLRCADFLSATLASDGLMACRCSISGCQFHLGRCTAVESAVCFARPWQGASVRIPARYDQIRRREKLPAQAEIRRRIRGEGSLAAYYCCRLGCVPIPDEIRRQVASPPAAG